MITLHGVSASPFVRKAMVVLAAKDLPYEHVQNMPFSGDEELKKISPLEKIPALRDGDLTIADSKVICRYLDNAYPSDSMYPQDPAQRAQADWLEEYGGTAVAEAAAGLFFHRFMRPVMLKQEVDETAVEEILTKKLPKVLGYLESQAPTTDFLFGEFGVADIALVSPFINAGYAKYSVDADSYPRFASLVERVKALDCVAPLLVAEAKALGL
ncbi:MAG: glutathione S-transferase family protein [Pseudomonadales bacterium]